MQTGGFLLKWFRPLRDSDWVLPYCISIRARYMLYPPTALSVGQIGTLPRS